MKGTQIELRTGKVDIGQRISTALVQIVHEELTVPQDRIDVAAVSTDAAPDEGITSGSNSIEQSGRALRLAAATLRAALQQAAAERHGGVPADWDLAEGCLTRHGTNRPIPLTDLMDAVAPDLRIDPDAALRPVADAPPRPAMRGMAQMVRGTHVFVQDLDVPGMLHARVVRPPQMHSRLIELPAGIVGTLDRQGIALVQDGSFLAVAGPVEWQVVRAAARLSAACSWSADRKLSEADVFGQLTREGATVRLRLDDSTPVPGPLPDPLSRPDVRVRYERPYCMHGSLAPSAALAEWSGGRLRITSHSQGIHVLRDSIAESLDLAREQVVVTHGPGSGCYGHNGADDAAFEAALIAMALPDTPVLLKWTREDEHAWEPYAPAMAVDLAVALGQDGRIDALSGEVFGDTFRGRPRSGPDRAGPARLLANRFRADPVPLPVPAPNMNTQGGLHRNLDPIYTIADKRLIKSLVATGPHRTSALRCLGAAMNIFAIESLMDELADKAGLDPLAYRRAHLDDPRAVAVLNRLETLMAQNPGQGAGRGIAYAQYKNAMTRVGVCVDIDMGERGEIHLLRAIIVADAGRVVDHDGLTAQLEGGFLQAASWTLHEEVTWDRDGITSRDWDSYPVIRFDSVPQIEVDIMPGNHLPSVGAGEASPGPTIAAIANAVFQATGLRMRRLPFTPDAVLRQATVS